MVYIEIERFNAETVSVLLRSQCRLLQIRMLLICVMQNPTTSSQNDPIHNWRQAMIGSSVWSAQQFPVSLNLTREDEFSRMLAVAFKMAKNGKVAEARAMFERVKAQFEASSKVSDAMAAELILIDAHIRAYEGVKASPEITAKLQWTLKVTEKHDYIGQGLALNQLCLAVMHSGQLDRAQEYGESAIRLYEQGAANLGSLHLLAHLGQIKLMRGDLNGATNDYINLDARLDQPGMANSALLAVSRALRSETAYEMNDLTGSQKLLDSSIQSVEEDDAWLDVHAAAYRVRIRLAFARAGLPAALSELSHCEHEAEKRNMARLLRLVQIERLRALTLSNEPEGALGILRSLGLDPKRPIFSDDDDWVFREASTYTAIARWMIRSRRSSDALTFIEPVEDYAIRRGQLLLLAKLRVIRAEAHWRLNQKIDATSSLLSSVRLLGQQPFRRFILDEGREVARIVQALLDGDHVNSSLSREHRKRFAELSHYSVVQQPSVTTKETVISDGSNYDKHATQYLELLAVGLSNKEIARIMGVSINTVKYHLKALFGRMRVSNRVQAVTEAARLGVISVDHPDG